MSNNEKLSNLFVSIDTKFRLLSQKTEEDRLRKIEQMKKKIEIEQQEDIATTNIISEKIIIENLIILAECLLTDSLIPQDAARFAAIHTLDYFKKVKPIIKPA